MEEGRPSTVLDLSGATPEVLRIGAISAEKIYSSQALGVPESGDVSPSGEEQE
jgi:tRNA A37 threonylcarbamoyladenosine synthetase subunit TsaC/SUA5/YrdC